MAILYLDGDKNRRYAAGTHTGAADDVDVSLESLLDSIGHVTDAAATGNGSAIALLKQLRTLLDNGLPDALGQANMAGSLPVVLASNQSTLPTLDTNSAAIKGDLDTLAGAVSAGKVQTDVPAKLPAALGQANMAASLPVTLASNQTSVPVAATLVAAEVHAGEVGGNLIMISTEFTRPADTTAYTANDVVSDNTTTTTMQALANAARVSGGSGYIVGIRIATDKKSIVPALRVHFFNTTGATLAGDNVAYKEVYADGSKRVAYYDMPAMTTAVDTTNSDMSRSVDMTMRIPYTCVATSLYYVLETLTAFTPASGEKITVTVFVDRN